MNNNENIIAENEFLNLLDEQESTLNDTLVLGDGTKGSCKEETCTLDCTDCERDCPLDGGCSNCDACDADGSICGGGGAKGGDPKTTGDDTPQTQNYYNIAALRIASRGYFKNGYVDDYPLTNVRFKKISVSGTSSTYTTILNSLGTNAKLLASAHTKFIGWSSYTPTALFTSASPSVFGYITFDYSASTHQMGFTRTIVSAHGYSTSSSANAQSVWNMANGVPGASPMCEASTAYLDEKKFEIHTFIGGELSGYSKLQGSKIFINNLSTIFPQFANTNYINDGLKTGREGTIVLSTSSTTSNTITGNARRLGMSGNNTYAFTATDHTVCNIPMHPNYGEDMLALSISDMLHLNEEIEYLYSGVTYPNDFALITKGLIYQKGIDIAATPSITNQTNACIPAGLLYSFRPGSFYLHNDPVFGKLSLLSYTVTAVTLSTSFKAVHNTITWYEDMVYDFNFPTVNYTGSATSAHLQIRATITGSNATQIVIYDEVLQVGYNPVNMTLHFYTFHPGQAFGGLTHTAYGVSFYMRVTSSVSPVATTMAGTYYYDERYADNGE